MSNFNYNHTQLGGRLTRDPELKQTNTGISVCTFSIAVNRPYKSNDEHPQADFFNCVAWRERGEMIAKYFRKGSNIFVEGHTENRYYEDKEGNKKQISELIVENVQFVESKDEANRNDAYDAPIMPTEPRMPPNTATQQNMRVQPPPSVVEQANDDDLPF